MQKRCVICYKLCGGGNLERNNGVEDEGCIRNQLAVIFLLRKFIGVPQQMCLKFLQKHGNPSLWIYWCDSCSSLIEEAQGVFRQVELLQKRAETLKISLKNAVIVSEQKEFLKNSSQKKQSNMKLKLQSTLTEEVRAYILLQNDHILSPSEYFIDKEEATNVETESEMFVEDSNISPESNENSSDEDESYHPNNARKRPHSKPSKPLDTGNRKTRSSKSSETSDIPPKKSLTFNEPSTSHKAKRSKICNSNDTMQVDVRSVSKDPSSESDDPQVEDSNSTDELPRNPPQKSSHPEVDELRKEFSGFKQSLKNQMELSSEIKETKRLLLQVLAAQAKPNNTICTLSPHFPLSSTEELYEMEDWLKIPENYSGQVLALSKIGGYKISKNIYNILDHVFSHSFAVNVRYTDTSGKIAFKGLKLADVIREAVRQTSKDVQPTDEEINQYMGRWFRNSSDRKGGRKFRVTKNSKTKSNNKNTALVKEEEEYMFEYSST